MKLSTPDLSGSARLADQLYGHLLEQIVSGALAQGDKLPSENALCKTHGVSRPIVREALLRLQADGVVHTRRGVGSFIRRRPPQGLIQFTEPSDVAGLLRCFEVRLPLEGATARLAAERISPRSHAAIDQALSHLSAAMDGAQNAEDADFGFHLAVAKAAGNDFFVDILTSLHGAVSRSMRVALGITQAGSKDRIRRVYEEHVGVRDAIVSQDGEAADLAMRYHLHRARQRITDHARDR